MGLSKQLQGAATAAYLDDLSGMTSLENLTVGIHWSYVPVTIRSGCWRVERVKRRSRPVGIWFSLRVWWKRLMVSWIPESTYVDNTKFKKALQEYRVDKVVSAFSRGALNWDVATVTPTSSGYVVNPPGPNKALKRLDPFPTEREAVASATRMLKASGGGRLMIQGDKGRIKTNRRVEP